MPGVFEYRIEFKTRAGALITLISSTAGRPPLLEAEWSTGRIGGCLNFGMKYPAGQLHATVSPGDIVTVGVKQKVVTDPTEVFWKGAVTSAPKAGSTARAHSIEAVGFWEQLVNTVVVEYYDGGDIDDIVIALLAAYDQDTDLGAGASTSEISVASPYTLGDFEVEYIKFSEALKRLAVVQGDIDYGVDQNGKLYFKDRTTTVDAVARFWVGKHVTKFEPTHSRDKIVNDLILQGKTAVGGGPLTFNRKDATSITAYGKRSKVIKLPQLPNLSDVWRYAEKLLDDMKDPFDKVDIGIAPFTKFVFPRGKAQIIDGDGTGHTFPIETVTYKLTGGGALSAELELGDEPAPVLADEIKQLLRDVEVERQSGLSSVQIEHTRGIAWEQRALTDARKEGNYNIALDSFSTGEKGMDQAAGAHRLFFEELSYFGAGRHVTKSIIQTRPLEIGQSIDTIRIHWDIDNYGRNNFAVASELVDFWNSQNGSDVDWTTRDGFSQIEQVASPGLTYDTTRQFTFPNTVANIVKFLIRNTGTTGVGKFRWGWDGSTTYNEIRFSNVASQLKVELFEVIVGVATSKGSGTLSSTDDAIIQVQFTDKTVGAGNTIIDVEDAANAADNFQISSAIGLGTNKQIHFRDFFTTATHHFRLEWFEVQAGSSGGANIFLFVSRDGGTTFVGSINPATGEGQTDFSLSGSPAGTSIVLKAEIFHPARVYGMGFSFKNQ